MSKMEGSLRELYSLEKLADRPTWVQTLHPAGKLAATLVYLIAVLSFDRFSALWLLPFLLYPVIFMELGEIPWGLLCKRAAVALPFCVFAGISNLFLERAWAFSFFWIPISFGALSFLTILIKSMLCVMAVIILIATTPMFELSHTLRVCRVPEMLVMLLEMTYRYLGTLVTETANMSRAYHLRAPGQRGIRMRDMGAFVGNLLLRSFDRAQRVYEAMKCRGYPAGQKRQKRAWHVRDSVFLTIVITFCIAFRAANLPGILSAFLSGVWK